MPIPVSVVIHTLNEEKNIRNCLESVKWAEEIVLVDMYSEDRTVEIARNYTDKICFFERCGGYVEPARRYGLEQVSHDWVLSVDADEMVPVTLQQELLRLADGDLCDLAYIPMVNYLFGRQMQGCGWGVDQVWHVRFFKKQFLTYSGEIHALPVVTRPNARAVRLFGEEHALVHFNYLDFAHFLEKLNRYTSIEAQSAYLAGQPFKLEEAWHKSLNQIQELAVQKGGYDRDGVYGLGLSFLMALYHFTTALKLKSMEDYHTTEPVTAIRAAYQSVADRLLKAYDN